MAKRYDDFSKAKENENTIMLMKVFFLHILSSIVNF